MKKPFGLPMTLRQALITAATAELCGFDMVGDYVLVPVDQRIILDRFGREDRPQEVVMADDKSRHGPQDRALVDGGEDYEVGYLMKKHHLERADALRLVKKYGNNRAKIEEELATRKV